MNIVEPSVEYWQQRAGMEGVWNQIAKAARTCYQSSVREGESSEDFVKRIILKPALIEGNLNYLEDCKFNFDKMHGAMLEHGTVYLTIKYNDFTKEDYDDNYDFNNVIDFYENNKYSKLIWANDSCYVTTNMRVIIENNRIKDLRAISKNIEHHIKRYTFSVITDIGVTREFNRHRVNSIAEQSSRYCTYSADKFGNEITYTSNSPFLECISDDKSYFHKLCEDIANNSYKSTWDAKHYYVFGLLAAEFAYLGLKKNKVPNDMARQVLNLNTRSQAVYTAFDDDWQHFIKLRADGISGKPHPNIKIIADMIKQKFEEYEL